MYVLNNSPTGPKRKSTHSPFICMWGINERLCQRASYNTRTHGATPACTHANGPGRAARHFEPQFGLLADPKISNSDRGEVAGFHNENIVRLQVAVRDVALVQVRQRLCHAQNHLDNLARVEPIFTTGGVLFQ